MDEITEARTKHQEAGRILSEVREESKKHVKEGAKLAELADWIENRIREKGASVAFPACLSLNDIAAHQSPGKADVVVIPEGAVIKVDIGAHVDGFIADTAYTIAFDPAHQAVVDASQAALAAAIEQCYTGNTVANVSAAIESAITEFGLKPISNLTGHGLGRFFLHESPSIPNVATNSPEILEEHQAIAIEPFATNGSGRVRDADFVTIFRIGADKPVRSPDARAILRFADEINGLPFSERWIPLESAFKTRLALRELREREILVEYPALREAGGGMVAQTEHSVIVGDKPLVFTK